MNEWTSCWCSGTPFGATALLLVLRHSCWCSGTPVGAPALLLVLRHSCWCFGTPVGATALLLREQACPDWCSGTPASATALLFCIVPSGTYYTASYSVLMIGLGSQIDIWYDTE